MKMLKMLLKGIALGIIAAALFIPATAIAAIATTVVLQWDPNTDSDLAGYKVYYSTTNVQPFTGTGAVEGASGAITVLKGVNTATISKLDYSKNWYFAVTAYNTAGLESAYSNVVMVPRFPTPPANVKYISILLSP
jgi:chitinase